ncbi:MAG: hypothetical protein NWF10_00190 [Candidatus Bathyarchaeota archaeon]|nr:hypothetical protein [Candidatus Bathyarchaeota archaeon]
MQKGAVIFLACVVLATLLSVSYSIAGREVSWIPIVEENIKKENWLPDVKYEPIASKSFFLYENGEEQFFILESRREFTSNIEGLLTSVDRKLDYVISRDHFDRILAKDRVVGFVLRFPNNYGLLFDVGNAYFVLEDVLGEDLEGTILVRRFDSSRMDWDYIVWEITTLSILYKFLSP